MPRTRCSPGFEAPGTAADCEVRSTPSATKGAPTGHVQAVCTACKPARPRHMPPGRARLEADPAVGAHHHRHALRSSRWHRCAPRAAKLRSGQEQKPEVRKMRSSRPWRAGGRWKQLHVGGRRGMWAAGYCTRALTSRCGVTLTWPRILDSGTCGLHEG